jgi:N-acetylneuraminate synthase
MKPIMIAGREISDQQPPYIIAELSANHNGDIKRALKTIDAAQQAGVSAIKIQSYTPDTMTLNSDKPDFMIHDGLWAGRSLYDLYGEAYTPFEWHQQLFDYARQRGITLFSSPFDETAVELLASLDAPAYKVASFELTDLPLIRCIAEQDKPMIMSTGMATLEEVGDALETAKKFGSGDVILLHCISSYPAPLSQANLRRITRLQQEFDVQVGLSDHTLGNTASILATALGASVIEKHFTLDRSDGGVDSTFSLEPSEMSDLVAATSTAHGAMGDQSFDRSACEQQNTIFRRSLYFVQDLAAGEIIQSQHIRRIRPGFGLAPKYLDQIIGQRLLHSVERGDRVEWQCVRSDDKA